MYLEWPNTIYCYHNRSAHIPTEGFELGEDVLVLRKRQTRPMLTVTAAIVRTKNKTNSDIHISIVLLEDTVVVTVTSLGATESVTVAVSVTVNVGRTTCELIATDAVFAIHTKQSNQQTDVQYVRACIHTIHTYTVRT